MANWKKLLWEMEDDTDPRKYTYEDAARVLRQLHFPDPTTSGSHRPWRLKLADGNVVRISLVQKGHGCLKPGYIRDMVKALRDNGLIPPRTKEDVDAVDSETKTQ